MSERRLTAAAGIALLGALVLMLAFEATLARIAGVALVLAFIVLGAFAIASPAYLAADADEPPAPR